MKLTNSSERKPPLRVAIDQVLRSRHDQSLDDLVAGERELGSPWTLIARRVAGLTGVKINASTLYRWYEEQPKEKASA